MIVKRFVFRYVCVENDFIWITVLPHLADTISFVFMSWFCASDIYYMDQIKHCLNEKGLQS